MGEEKTISNDCVSRLLVKLKPYYPVIRVCAKTLAKKPKMVTTPCGEGNYFHCTNWIKNVKLFIEQFSIDANNKELCLSINIDGLPLLRKI